MAAMTNDIFTNLFEFWTFIGQHASIINVHPNYTCTSPSNNSWPTKIFDLALDPKMIVDLKEQIQSNQLPNTISISNNPTDEALLAQHQFEETSFIKGMELDLSMDNKPKGDFSAIHLVTDLEQATAFARIISESFGHEILPSTIMPLLNSDPQLKLYIGKYKDKYTSCGMIFLDQKGISGLHMIGTIRAFQGKGLGKIMTNKLLLEAYQNDSKKVVLTASIAGERIYSKMGFVQNGSLKTYTLK